MTCTATQAQVMDAAEWHARHDDPTQITASEAAAAMGLDPYKPAAKLAAQKLGRIPRDEENLAMRRGKFIEPFVASECERYIGRRLRDPGDKAVFRHKEFDWLTATPDRLDDYDIPRRLTRPVELKDHDSRMAHHYKDGGCPLGYDVQAAVQAACVGVRRYAVFALVGTTPYLVERELDDNVWDFVIQRLVGFRAKVAKGILPEVDGSKASAELLRRLHPKDNGEAVELSWNVAGVVQEWRELKRQKKSLEAAILARQNIIEMHLGDNTFGAVDGRNVVSWKHQTRKEFTVAASETRVLREVKS